MIQIGCSLIHDSDAKRIMACYIDDVPFYLDMYDFWGYPLGKRFFNPQYGLTPTSNYDYYAFKDMNIFNLRNAISIAESRGWRIGSWVHHTINQPTNYMTRLKVRPAKTYKIGCSVITETTFNRLVLSDNTSQFWVPLFDVLDETFIGYRLFSAKNGVSPCYSEKCEVNSVILYAFGFDYFNLKSAYHLAMKNGVCIGPWLEERKEIEGFGNIEEWL